MPAQPFFTVGHSNRTLQEFIDLLQHNDIELLVDVRRLPGSARYPHFDEDPLRTALAEVGIEFQRAQALTGRRPVSKEIPFEVNAWWQNRSFHNYADHALGEEFGQGLEQLRGWGEMQRSAVMCSEAVWWRCHRRIIADHLLARSEQVLHIMGPNNVDEARLSEGAKLAEDGTLTYPVPRDSSGS